MLLHGFFGIYFEIKRIIYLYLNMIMNLAGVLSICLICSLTSAHDVEDFSWQDVDGRSYIPEVKNQNFPSACNSGWALATVDMLNTKIKIFRNASSPDISLSTQVLLSCDTYDFGCMGVRFI